MMLFLCLLSALSLFNFTNGRSIEVRIVNGTNSLPGQFPYAVSVRYYDKHECGGSVIGERWILTAAHCIYSNFINVSSILFGTVELHNAERPVNYTRGIKRAIPHPLYVPSGNYENDVGLLELEEPLAFNEFVKPIKLPNSYETTPAGLSAILVGWGYPDDLGDVFEILQNVEIKVYSDEYCVTAHNGITNPEVHICAGVDEGGKGQCTGDSGGPLAINGIQYGVVSWSQKPCTLKGYPGVFAKVSTYRNWIYENAGI